MTMRDWYFAPLQVAFGKNIYNDFMIKYGRQYAVGPETYAGPRGEPRNCFANAYHLAADNRDLTYVEGKVACHGVPLDHAWCVNRALVVVDPTIVNDDGRITDYYGVPLMFDYVSKAILWNDCYGVLDYFYAGKTSPKLYELGLEAGQEWLLRQPLRPPRKRKLK